MRRFLLPLLVVGSVYLLLLLGLLLGPRLLPERHARRLRASIWGLVLIYPLVLVVLSALHVLLPRTQGLLAVTQVGAPYLFVPLIALVPFALLRGARLVRAALAVCLVIFGLRFVSLPPLAPFAAGQPARALTVLSWNTGIAPGDYQVQQQPRVRPVLQATEADVVVLQEAYWRWIEQDAELAARYPHRAILAADKGLLLLSRYPILEHNIPQQRGSDWPRQILARLDLGAGRSLHVLAAHPPAPVLRRGCGLLCVDTTERDRQLHAMRRLVEPIIASGEPLLLVGDLNLTEREPLYGMLSAGLQDVHERAGAGLGASWPILVPVPGYPVASGLLRPLLRIDHMFASPGLLPLAADTDCSPHGSDHCMISARIGLP